MKPIWEGRKLLICVGTGGVGSGPRHSPGRLYGGARQWKFGSRVDFYFRRDGHLDPPNVCSIDSARREDGHGAFTFSK